MDNLPKITCTIKNDIGAFMCTFPPIIFAALSVFLFLRSEIGQNHYSSFELFYISLIIFVLLSFCLWPFIIWWQHVINKTFKYGVELNAESCKMNLRFVIGLGVKYTFNYNGKKFEHISSLVSNNKTKKLANDSSVSIIFSPENNVSFIKDVYI